MSPAPALHSRGFTHAVLVAGALVLVACASSAETAGPSRDIEETTPAEAPAQEASAQEPATEAPPAEEEIPPREETSTADVRRVAITIDDIPFVGRVGAGDSRLGATQRLLGNLRTREAPATAFVVCRGLARSRPIVDAWRTAGVELANHTNTHRDIDTIERDEWERDIERCHESLTEIRSEPPRWFRYPYLRRGQSDARHRASLRAVRALGSTNAPMTIAPVSIDTNDWALARPYAAAVVDGDTTRAEELARVFVTHVVEAAEHFDRLGEERTGRSDVAHVLLLHANLLVADHLGSLLEALAERGWRFITLEEAMADPVYARADAYVGHTSMSWLCRFDPVLTAGCEVDVESEADFRRRYW